MPGGSFHPEPHPHANLFPLLQGDEFQALGYLPTTAPSRSSTIPR